MQQGARELVLEPAQELVLELEQEPVLEQEQEPVLGLARELVLETVLKLAQEPVLEPRAILVRGPEPLGPVGLKQFVLQQEQLHYRSPMADFL